MPKRSASDALQAVVPAPKTDVSMKSRSGRVVKPKVWDDGTLAAPLAVLKEDGGELPTERDSDADPDYSHELGSDERGTSGPAHHGHGQGQRGGGAVAAAGNAAGGESEEEEGYSEDSPRVSAEGSQGGSMGRARSSSVGRDEHGKFTSGPRPRGAGRGRGARGEGGGGIFKMAAVEVLRLEKRLMSTGEIARVALKRGLIKCTGKTPEATMASALYTDIKRKEGQSIFIRPHEGLFGLREWIEQGVAFQDEYAEEMAKRVRATFGPFVGMPGMPPMLPPMMDSEGMPISTPYPPMMPFPGMPPMPGMALPGMPMVPGMPPPAAAAAAAAAKGGGAAADDSPDGLMELLSAAEELHKSASKDKDDADVKYGPDGAPIPATAAPAEAAAPGAATPAAAEGAAAAAAATAAATAAVAPMEVEEGQAAAAAAAGEGQQAEAGAAPAGAPAAQEHQQDAPAAATAAAVSASQSEGAAADNAAAALLSAVAEAAAEEPASRRSPAEEGMDGRRHAGAFPGFSGMVPPEAGAAGGGMPYPMQYPPYGYPPYGYYPHPYHHHHMYAPPPPAPAGLPPLPKGAARGSRGYADLDPAAAAAADLGTAASGSGSIDLVVRGSNRPFLGLAAAATAGGNGGSGEEEGAAAAALAAAAAAMEAGGQEQVNILNLPLPEVDSQGNMAGPREGAAQPAAAELEPAQLKEAEAQVMRLEKELGTSHPEVGKAYLSLSRLYLAGCIENSSKQLAMAALSRACDIMSVNQVALKRQPSCQSSFDYLMEKMRSSQQQQTPSAGTAVTVAPLAPAPQRPVGEPVAHGEAAHVALPTSAVAAH